MSSHSHPFTTFDSPNSSYRLSTTCSLDLDYDILTNPKHLDNFNLTDYYNDFTLFATTETFIDSPFSDLALYPSLESLNTSPLPPPAPSPQPSPAPPRYFCIFANCTESFARQCELTRHEFKHTQPFVCRLCARPFAEKRRCLQHEQTVHGLATDTDKTKCSLCSYSHVRPDAVKRHLKLKHGAGSPSSGSSSGEGTAGPKPRRGKR
jgi:hypothetical protein